MTGYHVLDKSVRSSIEYLEVSKPCFSPVLLDGSARSKPSSSRMALNSRIDSHGRAYKPSEASSKGEISLKLWSRSQTKVFTSKKW